MTNAKTTKTTPATVNADDKVMGSLVGNFEKEMQSRGQVHLADLIDANTRGVLTLFPFKAREMVAGKKYPVMSGHIDTKRVKVPVSAFEHMTDEGRTFLSLSIGVKDQNRIGGAVFRQEEQAPTGGKWEMTPGKENDRFGVLSKQVVIAGTDVYETIFELRFYGKRLESRAGVYYIKAQVYPERNEGVMAERANDDDFDKGCF
jgi:hypothetical protein